MLVLHVIGLFDFGGLRLFLLLSPDFTSRDSGPSILLVLVLLTIELFSLAIALAISRASLERKDDEED